MAIPRAMLKLHYLSDSRAHRILWMLEEMGVDYDVEVHLRRKDRLAPQSIRDLHPVGKAPLLQDGDRILAESGHIVEYLAERHAPHLIPEGDEARLDYKYWMHFAEGSLAPPLIATYLFSVVEGRVPSLLRPVLLFAPRALEKAYYEGTLANLMGFVNEHLDGREFFVGDALSGADIMMSFPLEASRARFPEHRNIGAWVDRMQARPAYRAALKKAGVPYAVGGGAPPR